MDGRAPDPGSWGHSNPENYIDCVAYGGYSGPIPSHVGTASLEDPQGHSMHRVFDTNDNDADFRCGTPSPQDILFDQASYLMASTPCEDPRFYTLAEPLPFTGTGSFDMGHDLVGTILPVANPESIPGFPICADNSQACFQPLGDTVFYRLEVGPGSDAIRSVGAIVTNDSRIQLIAPQAGGMFPDDPMMPTGKQPDGSLIFGHIYGGFGFGVSFSTPLVDGDLTTILFVHYPTGSVERAAAEGGGIAAEVFGPPGIGSFETGFVPAPEPDALLAGLTAALAVAAARRRRAHS
jgi:hypothetical protein